jgi:replicative DNA helicase
MGKTALALGIAQHAAGKDKKQTLFFSLEMSTAELSDRVAAAQIGVSAWKIEKGDLTDRQVQQIGESVTEVKPWPLYIDDDHDTSLSNLRTKALEHKMEHGLDFIIIDYLQLVELPHGMRPKENFHQEISIISRGLKKLARELEVPILALSQLNRSVENTPQCIPQLSHLRESGKIEEDAHLVILLWREGYYNEDCAQPDMTTAFIRKNRQGPIGSAELMFNKQLMTFSSVDHHHADPQKMSE